jgi:antitoxin component YwqK of YwqJK toxin-antitoxin module
LEENNMRRVPNKSLEYDDGLMFLDGEPFTGAGNLFDDDGKLVGEIEYRNGLEWGMKRGWNKPGELYYEGPFFMGVLHGKQREWHPNRQLAEEADYELGFLRRKKRWDENGNLEEEYELKETDPDYKALQEYRRMYKDALAKEESRENA